MFELLRWEARLLDTHRYGRWLELVADDVRYLTPPVRPHTAMALYDAAGLRRRVASLRTKAAGRAALPATWRSVGLIGLRPLADADADADADAHAHADADADVEAGLGIRVVEARSSVVLWWRPETGDGHRVVMRRRDTWRYNPTGWRLVRRVVHATPAVLPAWTCALLL